MARSIQVVITADARGMGRGVAQANAQLKSLQATARQSQQSLSKIDGMFNTFSKGAVAAAGLAAVGTAIMSVVNSASRLQQSQGAVEAIFKGQAGALIAGAGAWQEYGLSQSQVLETQALLGAQLKNLGAPIEGLSGQVNGLIKLGADLAATFGGTTVQATEALSSALRGEYERIEAYGISIKQATVDAKASAEGLTKQQALLSIVFEQSADAIGQADREIDTFASRQQQATAAFENAKTALGEGLLPVATQVAGAVSGVAEAFSALPKGLIEFTAQAALAVGAYKALSTAATVAAVRTTAANLALVQGGGINTWKNAAYVTARDSMNRLNAVMQPGPILAVGAAFLVVDTALNKLEAEMREGVGTASEFFTLLKQAGDQVSSIQTDLGSPIRIFDDNAVKNLNDIIVLSQRSKLQNLASLLGGGEDGYVYGQTNAAKEQLQAIAEGITQLAAVNPAEALREIEALKAALSAGGYSDAEIGTFFADAGIDIEAVEAAADSATVKVEALTQSFTDLQETAKLANDALEAVFAPRSLVESKIGLRGAINDLRELKAEASGADIKTAVIGVGKAWQDVAARQIEAGKSQEVIIRGWEQSRQSAKVALSTVGVDGKKAERILDVAFGKKRDVKIALDTAGVTKGTGIAAKAIAGVKQKKPTVLDVNSTLALAKVAVMQASLAAIPDETVNIYVGFTGPGAGAADKDGDGIPGLLRATPFAAPPGFSQSTGSLSSSLSSSLVGAVAAARRNAQKEMNKGIKVPPFVFAGDANFKKLFEIDADVAKKNQDKYKQIVDKVVGYWQTKYDRLYDRLNQLERDRAALARDLAGSISAFSITDQLSGARDAAREIADLQKEAAEATTESWAHLDPILNEMRATTDPVRLAELRNTYNTLIAAGPRTVADTAKRAEIEAKIAELRKKDTLLEQVQEQNRQTQQFAAQLRQLKQQGFGPDALAEIAKAGPEAGLALTEQLIANKGLRDEWIKGFREMKDYSTDAGTQIARFKFKPDIKEARGDLRQLWKNAAADLETELKEKLKKADLKVKVDVELVLPKSGKTSTAAAPINITINGAIDPEGTARSVKRVLAQHDRRVGVS